MTDLIAEDVFTEPAPAFSPASLRGVVRENWDVPTDELRPLDSERDLNALVADDFVIKIANPAERVDVLEMEVRALDHVHAADPGLTVPVTIPARTGAQIVRVRDDVGRECLARLITRLDGRPLEGHPVEPDLAAQVGAIAGRTSVALQGFFHAAAGRELLWDIRRLPDLLAGSAAVGLQELADRVAPALAATAAMPAGVQHADVTLTNVLADAGTVTGVIDFGDMHHTAAACDLAVTLASVLRATGGESEAIWRLAEATLRGYQRYRLLTDAEVASLGELVIARLVTTLAVSATRRDKHSENYRYITQYDQNSRRVLDTLTAFSPDHLAGRFGRLTGSRSLSRPTPGLRERRAGAMGGPLSPLFYSEPLELVRGAGPWLFSRAGERYLDAYNNVAVIGHAHPTVTNAVATQLSALNTHSRYLHPGIVELAERLLATMPPQLDTCLFTTSGTEANELAWRLATEYTGANGAIIAEHAYHGSSKWMADLSSNEWPPGHRPAHVATFPAPRGDVTGQDALERIRGAACSLHAAGDRPALVLADAQFTSEGILDVPAEFARALAEGARAAGALYLADEVQSGYGRSGPALWRFALADVTPDLVTLGKPMGAGYPIGAVITRREIADALAQRYEYFSTFAATPAAAAAGHAVLDVLEATGLPEQAVGTGAALRARLRELAADEPMLGEVRGTGLLAGVDVHAPEGGDSRALTRLLLDGLVSRGVLAGATGPGGDVLKIRPPLVWTIAEVDLFAGRLREALADSRRSGGPRPR